jgi:nucleoid-associated protein YgaU
MSTGIALTGASAPAPASGTGGGPVASYRPRAQLQKAVLRLYDAKPGEGGTGALGAERAAIPFQFNPKEVSITKSAKWERKTAKGSKKAGPPEFSGAEPCKLTLEMFFDASGKHDDSVLKAVEMLFSCCVPTDESIAQKKASPPLVELHWGAVKSFPAFVSQVSAKYTLFSADGMPIRALCSISLDEMPTKAGKTNPTSGGLSVNRAHTVVAGDSLASIAYAEYSDPTMWRALAVYNRIDDPLRLAAGSSLLLPPSEELLVARG